MSDISWVSGLNMAVAKYITSTEMVATSMFQREPSPLNKHFATCGIAEAANANTEAEEVSTFDTFDSDASRAAMYIAVDVTCNCGEYTKHHVTKEAELQDVICAVTR